MFTGTRADFGLLSGLIIAIDRDTRFQLQLLVGGTHFSSSHGQTYKEILAKGLHIDGRIDLDFKTEEPLDIAINMGSTVSAAARELGRLQPDLLILLGDRYEALAVAQAAVVFKLPIIHLHGGEKTEGAYDDSIRHAITKLSYLHCVASEEYKNRVIQLGEDPERVFNVGAIGLQNIKNCSKMSISEFSKLIGVDELKPFFLLTYHPETLSSFPVEKHFYELQAALESFQEHTIIFTYPNADQDGKKIISYIDEYASANPDRVIVVPSLGLERYVNAMRLAEVIIGNSSSGIIEAPSCQTPTVNIGARQQGRLCARSVIHAQVNSASIREAILRAMSFDFLSKRNLYKNPYGNGDVTESVLELLDKVPNKPNKQFYDLGIDKGKQGPVNTI